MAAGSLVDFRDSVADFFVGKLRDAIAEFSGWLSLDPTLPRVEWATPPRRGFSVDVLECPKCHGRLRVIAVIPEREPARRILAHLGLPTDPLPVARARDPTDDADEAGNAGQLALGLA